MDGHHLIFSGFYPMAFGLTWRLQTTNDTANMNFSRKKVNELKTFETKTIFTNINGIWNIKVPGKKIFPYKVKKF